MWPMPSPIRLSWRWTRKKPTAGASTPTIAPAARASRMNSESRMDMGGVVPAGGQVPGRAVEGDPAADDQQPSDVGLDRAELMRDVDHGDADLGAERVDQGGERLLGARVDTGRGLVEDQQFGLRRQRLGDERSLPLAAGEVGEGAIRLFLEPHPRDGGRDRSAVGVVE